jgi:5,10-methylenetetrahydrofolate reductase
MNAVFVRVWWNLLLVTNYSKLIFMLLFVQIYIPNYLKSKLIYSNYYSTYKKNRMDFELPVIKLVG